VAALRSELAEHHSRLLELVTQRLEAISFCAEVPETLSVFLPNGPSVCEGLYSLEHEKRPNGYPLWKKEDSNHWIYSMQSERWGIGGEKERDQNFIGDAAYVFCPDPHNGQMPNEIQSAWKRNNPAWTIDHGITVRAVHHANVSVARGTESLVRMHGSGQGQHFSNNSLRTSAGSPSYCRARQARIGAQPLHRGTPGRSTLEPPLRNIPSGHPMQNADALPGVVKTISAVFSSRSPRPVFSDCEKMKQQLLQGIRDGEYNVEKYYRDDGICQRIARSTMVEYLTLVMVGINIFWIGYDVDNNDADALPQASAGFQFMENLFCIYFTGEILIRFVAFKEKRHAFIDPSFVVDLALVCLMIFETWFMYALHVVQGGSPEFMDGAGALSLLRILRLSRMCRLVRLLRAVPELMMLIKGLLASARSVLWTIGLLGIIVYVFSIGFKIITKGSRVGSEYFSSVSAGMVTLILPGLLPDTADTAYDIASDNAFAAVVFMAFILVAAITMMNLLIGVLVEGVSTVADVEKEALVIATARGELMQLFKSVDKDNSDTLSLEELESILLNPQSGVILNRLGVDIQSLVDNASFQLFRMKDSISFPEFLELALELRGSNQTKVRDIINLRKFIADEIWQLEDRLLIRTRSNGLARTPGMLIRTTDESSQPPSTAWGSVADEAW